MANAGSVGILRHIDDPSITVINTASAAGLTWVSAGDSSDTPYVKAVAAGKGLHYAGALTTTDNQMVEFSGNNLQFTAQEGHCEVEILAQWSLVAGLAFNFGFNDQILETANSLPLELATTTISANSASFLGFVFDIDADNDDLHCGWVNSSVVGQTDADGSVDGEPIRMEGLSPTLAQWLYMKVELQDRGSGLGARAVFTAIDHNGKSDVKTFNTTLTRSTPLAFYYGIENRDAVGMSMFIRMPNWAQGIPDM